MTDVALPVPVDILVPATLLDPTPADLMLAHGGVAFASSTDAARAYPDLWRTPSAAKSAMARAEKLAAFPYVLQKEASAPNIATVEYQQAGQGKRSTVAVFDLCRVPNPKRHLESLFGELAVLRVLAPEQPAQETAPAALRRRIETNISGVRTAALQSEFFCDAGGKAHFLGKHLQPAGGGARARASPGVVRSGPSTRTTDAVSARGIVDGLH